MAFLFENLMAYQEALRFSEDVFRWTKHPALDKSLVNQLRRAALSIPANFAEGYGRWHARERTQFFRIAIGSAYECLPYISLATSESVLSESESIAKRQHLELVVKLIMGFIKSQSHPKPFQ